MADFTKLQQLAAEGKLSRRQFMKQAAATGATVALATSAYEKAFAATPSLTLYVVLWSSSPRAGRIPWNSSSPKEVAERFCFTIWSYAREFTWRSIFLDRDKGSVIGHAALFAKMRKANGSTETIVYSNTGGDVGFYRNPIILLGPGSTSKFPTRAPYRSNPLDPIVACFYVNETFAGHSEDGHWEKLSEFRNRVRQRRRPRARKKVISGSTAERTFALLRQFKVKTEPFETGAFGGPKHYGLNTLQVRRMGAFNNPKSMTRYQIGNGQYEAHGGCANAVASVLEAAGQGDLVPRSAAEFEVELALDAFRNAVLPILVGSDAFRGDGRTRDNDLRNELNRLPTRWGSGDRIKFVDPNYWHDTVSRSDSTWQSLKADLGI